ncbi:hypothetical protein LTR70_003266 [Exophiala xenobiotica]|uniref:Uncharacterized protein n=1 Tax=Lithohypha guttulata TaxID=1690604 RepID=A0ABR0KLY0_9EURO|nr:hypothetical protein LTR24_001141 [Lithohypha guttulata]KAK5323588.1 hypothetical protein LTR70_003266 [Exophiala xenobiotica]
MVEMLIVSLAAFIRRPSRILDLPLSRLRIVRINHETVLNLFVVKDRTADDVADAWLGEAAPMYKGVIQRDMQTALQDPTTLEQFSGIELQAVWKVIGMPRLSEDKGFILYMYFNIKAVGHHVECVVAGTEKVLVGTRTEILQSR